MDTSALRNTPQRQLVLNVVKENTNHPTADEIYELARLKDSKISKGTVYRNLNTLCELGQILKINIPFGADHFDFNLSNHYHFVCRNCQKVVDADIRLKDILLAEPSLLKGYKVETFHFVLVGLCPICLKNFKEEI